MSSPQGITPKKSQANQKKGISTIRKAPKAGRIARIYPALSFEETCQLGEAIHQYASAERVNRLTLLQKMNKSPTSSAIQILITSSGKYGITKGSFKADYLEFTEIGKIATDPLSPAPDKLGARFKLGIEGIEPFAILYSKCKGKRMPAHEVLIDALKDAKLEITDYKECVDLFIVNAKFLGLLQTIAGSETLLPIETVSEQLGGSASQVVIDKKTILNTSPEPGSSKPRWSTICFYITPIGEEGSEQRKHSDLFLNSIVEPALGQRQLEIPFSDN